MLLSWIFILGWGGDIQLVELCAFCVVRRIWVVGDPHVESWVDPTCESFQIWWMVNTGRWSLVAGHHYSNQYYSAPFVKERPRSHDSCGVGHGCGRGLPWTPPTAWVNEPRPLESLGWVVCSQIWWVLSSHAFGLWPPSGIVSSICLPPLLH